MGTTETYTETGYTKKILVTLCEKQARDYINDLYNTHAVYEKICSWEFVPEYERICFIVRVFTYGADGKIYPMDVSGTATDYAGIVCSVVENSDLEEIVWCASKKGREYLHITEPYLNPHTKTCAKAYIKEEWIKGGDNIGL